MAQDDAINLAYGVGGRLAAPKSELYRQAIVRVEARANAYVARPMLASDIAYVLTAVELGVTSREDGRALARCLVDLLEQVDELVKQPGAADIVTQREAWVSERVGRDISSRLHAGRNRGESVRNYLPRLFFRQALYDGRVALLGLISALHRKAQPVLTALAPVYHHLQHAGVTTLGEYLLSWAVNLSAHLERMEQADARLMIAPPGQTNRYEVLEIAERVARRLGFPRVSVLRQEMHVTEDQLIEPFFALTMTNVMIARLLSDLRIWMTDEFALFQLADAHAAGSSVLPQKKNPFGFQVVIGGAAVSAGRLSAQLSASIAPCEELDSILVAGSLYEQARDMIGWTSFVAEAIEQGTFNLAELERKATLGFQGAPEAQDELIYRCGVPMRLAHHELGYLVRCLVEGRDPPDLRARLSAELGRPVDIDNTKIVAIVRGDVVPESALNIPAVHRASQSVADTIARETSKLGDQSPVDRVIATLVRDARAL